MGRLVVLTCGGPMPGVGDGSGSWDKGGEGRCLVLSFLSFLSLRSSFACWPSFFTFFTFCTSSLQRRSPTPVTRAFHARAPNCKGAWLPAVAVVRAEWILMLSLRPQSQPIIGCLVAKKGTPPQLVRNNSCLVCISKTNPPSCSCAVVDLTMADTIEARLRVRVRVRVRVLQPGISNSGHTLVVTDAITMCCSSTAEFARTLGRASVVRICAASCRMHRTLVHYTECSSDPPVMVDCCINAAHSMFSRIRVLQCGTNLQEFYMSRCGGG